MRKFTKIFAILFSLIAIITLAACSSGAGVEAVMSYKASTNKITITCTFAANSKLESGDAVPNVRQYHYESDGSEKSDEIVQKVTFDKSNTEASVEFKGLERNTTYLFKMYVTYDGSDTFVTQIEAKTSSYDDDTPIEINSKEDFLAMNDDPAGNYILKTDIDFNGEKIDSMFSDSSKAFTGKFNGDGHRISNFRLGNSTYVGVFGYTDEAIITNLEIEGVDATSLSGTVSAGALIGNAKSTKVSNVAINDVKLTITGSSGADINLGGVVGYSEYSTFENTTIRQCVIDFTRIRQRVNCGLFAGVFSGDSIGQKEVNNKNVNLIADACSAKGSITGVLYYPSVTSGTDAYCHMGGFAGSVMSKSLITNSFTVCDINLSKNTTSSNTNDYDLVVGGFVGLNEGGLYLNITKSFAKSNIVISSGEKITDETTQAKKDELMEVTLVNKDRTVSVGGFAGVLYKYISCINDCYYDSNIEIYAKETRAAVDSDRTRFERAIGKKSSKCDIGDSIVISGVKYEITGETIYYTIDATEATVADQTELEAGTYYVASGDNYNLATTYDASTTYYTLNAVIADVNEETKFGATATNTYYTLSEDNYVKATAYTPKDLIAYYILTNSDFGYSYISEPEYATDSTKINNVESFSSTSDLTKLDEFVVNLISDLYA